MTFIQKFLNIIPGNNLRKAMDHLSRGEYGKACEYFETFSDYIETEAVDHEKQEMIRMYMSESYIEYSKILKREGKLKKAAEALEKVTRLEPEYSDVHYMLAELYEALEDEKNSIAFVKKALASNPNYFSARIFLAKLNYTSGKKTTSLDELRNSLRCAPGFYVEKVNDLILNIKNDVESEKVMEMFTEVLRERPTSAQVSKQMALESIQEGNYDSAIRELKKALSINPDYPDLRNLLGIAYANKGLKDDAIVEFNTALKINPEYLKAHLNIALTYYEKGAFNESRAHLEKVLEVDAENELARNIMDELTASVNQG